MSQKFYSLLSDRPLLGFGGSLLTISITHLQFLQVIAALLGIIIAVITAILKIIELREKLEQKRLAKEKVIELSKKSGRKRKSSVEE